MHDSGTRTIETDRAPIGNGRLAIMLLVASEIMLFAGVVAGYVVLRFGGAGKASAGLPPGSSLAATVLLVISTLLVLPVPRLAARASASARALTLAALAAGAAFVVIGGLAWWKVVASGDMTLDVRIGTSGVLIGLHLLHAVVGLVLLALPLAGRGSRADFGRFGSLASVATFYWHFVTLTWIALVGALYLL